MLPILFRLRFGGADVAIGAYSTFMTLAWIATVAVGTAVAARRGIPARRALAVFAAALVAALVGGRLLGFALAPTGEVPGASGLFDLTFQAFSLYGALIFGAVAGVGVVWRLRLPYWRMADCAVPALAVGIALMRVGCFLRGCCFGLPTTMPWGVTFPVGSPAWEQQMLSGATGILGGFMGEVLPVHPTQLYELVAVLVIGGAATWLMVRGGAPDGVPFLAAVMAFTVFRLADFALWRAPFAEPLLPGWAYPVVHVGVLLVASVFLAFRLRAGTRPRA